MLKAVILSKNGKTNVLKVTDVDPPKITSNEVLIKTSFAGINYAELLSRHGSYSWSPKKPYILGMEGSGEVVEVGSDVDDFIIGDHVAAAGQYGSYSEYRGVKNSQVFKLPADYTLQEGAALLATYATAWIALHEMARVRPKERILIHAAAGGVGLATIQLAKIHGMEIYGTASSPEKRAYLETLGCHALEYDTFHDKMYPDKRPDCIIETVGGSVYRKSFRILAPMGRIVLVGATGIQVNRRNPLSLIRAWRNMPKTNLLQVIGRSRAFMGLHIGYLLDRLNNFKQTLNPLLEILDKHNIKPDVKENQIFPMSQVADAHQFIHDRKNIGKVLLDTSK